MTPPRLHVLIRGVVGSTAYGLNRVGSDIDRAGIFAAPTRQVLGLYPVRQSIATKSPDLIMHELGKWCRLALNGNPSVMELLWLPKDLYETVTVHGHELIAMRSAFLSAPKVRAAYLGFADQQLSKLLTRQPGENGGQRKDRVAKHARHLGRLLHQGLQAYTTGRVVVRLPADVVDQCWILGGEVAAGRVEAAQNLLADYEAKFEAATTPLPKEPDSGRVDAWVRQTRVKLLDVGGPDIEQEHQS